MHHRESSNGDQLNALAVEWQLQVDKKTYSNHTNLSGKRKFISTNENCLFDLLS